MCLFLIKTSLAQNIEQEVKKIKNLGEQTPLDISGSIGVNTLFYQANGIAPRRDPFFYSIYANLTLTLFNSVSVPFTAIVTKQNQTYSNGLDKFSQPFNQFGLSPSYKAVTIHAGYRSLQFSEYTLAGALFLGGGLEIKPQKSFISGSAMYGRFVKAMPGGGEEGVSVNPSYQRMGGGAKLTIGTDVNFGEIIFLKIKDDVNSIPFDTALSETPQENQIIAVGTKQKLNSILSLDFNLSYSMFTKNLYEEPYKLAGFDYVNQIYTVRPSSSFNKAINAGIDLTPGKYRIGMLYKRIDPDYKSLGSVFLTNDIEEISVNAGSSFLKNKLNATISGGYQHNNLDKIQILTSRRVIASLNISYNVTKKFNFSANYSNFNANTVAQRDLFTDSIRFIQLTQNGGINVNYTFEQNQFKHVLCNSLSYMEAGGSKQANTNFLNETLSYSLFLNDYKIGINTSFIYNKGTSAGQSINEGYGPNLALTKSFFKDRIKLVFSSGFQNTYLNKQVINKNETYSFNFSYTVDKHQSLRANGSLLKKKAVDKNAQQFSEIRVGLAYTYNFGLKTKKINS